jgi:hypothetical protein
MIQALAPKRSVASSAADGCPEAMMLEHGFRPK